MNLCRYLIALLAALAVLGGCGSGSTAVESTTTPDSATKKVIAEQTVLYERAGVSHADAACLANVTGPMKVQANNSGFLDLFDLQQQEAIDRCHMRHGALTKIGAYVRSHPPNSN